MASAGRSFSTAVPEQLQLLPLLFKVSPAATSSSLPATPSHPGGLSPPPPSPLASNPLLTPPSVRLQIAPVENDDSYDELKRDAKTCLSLMSQGLLYPEQIPQVLHRLQEVSHSPHGGADQSQPVLHLPLHYWEGKTEVKLFDLWDQKLGQSEEMPASFYNDFRYLIEIVF